MDPKTIGGIPVKLMEDGVLAGDTNPVNKKAIYLFKNVKKIIYILNHLCKMMYLNF